MELCDCPSCGAPAEVSVQESYDARPGDTVRVQCLARHWFLGPRRLLVPEQAPPVAVPEPGGRGREAGGRGREAGGRGREAGGRDAGP
jgi:hypothetical protein